MTYQTWPYPPRISGNDRGDELHIFLDGKRYVLPKDANLAGALEGLSRDSLQGSSGGPSHKRAA